VTPRIALATTSDDKLPFVPCSVGPGEPAPACSQPLRLEDAIAGYEAAIAGVLDTGRYRMRYRVWGRGPALIFIHGLADCAASFVLPMSRLAEKFCCISYELPNGAGDGAALGRYRLEMLVDDLFALCDHLRLESAIPLGVSFGSMTAIRALARDPKRFPTGIIQGGFAYRRIALAEVLLARFARWWPGPIRRLPLHDKIIEQYHTAEFARVEPSRWPCFLAQQGSAPTAAVAHRVLWIASTDLRPVLPTIRQPVLLICGDNDPLIGKSCEADLMRGLPNVARAEIESCGHLPAFTHPEVYAEIVEQFLGRSLRHAQHAAH
jgi:pimeloyl-ACP methyl ester carboxylesterase